MSSEQDLPPEDGPDPIGEALAEVRDALSELTAAAKQEHERASHRESIIDRLHDENQLLRRGEIQVMYDPVRAALYRLHDMLKRAALDPPDREHASALLTAFADEAAEALGRTGVERFGVLAGDAYDPVRHRPMGTEPVTDPALDGTVASVLTDGFELGEQVVRRAEVRVGRLTERDSEGS